MLIIKALKKADKWGDILNADMLKKTLSTFFCYYKIKGVKMKRKNNILSPKEKEIIVKRYLNGDSIKKMAKEKKYWNKTNISLGWKISN